MTYTKPELVTLSHAVAAIQGSTVKRADLMDANQQDRDATSAAYEADE